MRLAALCVLLACGGDGDGDSEGGSFIVDWELLLNGSPVECDTTEVAEIVVITSGADGAPGESFACDAGTATTTTRPEGDYTIQVLAVDDAGGVLTNATDTGSIIAGQDTDLGSFPLELGAAACDASSCSTGCCQGTTCVDPQTDVACGRGGVACNDCTDGGQTCNTTEGMCID